MIEKQSETHRPGYSIAELSIMLNATESELRAALHHWHPVKGKRDHYSKVCAVRALLRLRDKETSWEEKEDNSLIRLVSTLDAGLSPDTRLSTEDRIAAYDIARFRGVSMAELAESIN